MALLARLESLARAPLSIIGTAALAPSIRLGPTCAATRMRAWPAPRDVRALCVLLLRKRPSCSCLQLRGFSRDAAVRWGCRDDGGWRYNTSDDVYYSLTRAAAFRVNGEVCVWRSLHAHEAPRSILPPSTLLVSSFTSVCSSVPASLGVMARKAKPTRMVPLYLVLTVR